MGIPAEVQEVIRLAKVQEIQEQKLDEYKAQKKDHQSAIDELNIKIADQQTIVQSARAALKSAAQII